MTLHSIKILDFVNFLMFEESYNVKLVFYSVKLISIVLLLPVGLGHTHTTPQKTNSITRRKCHLQRHDKTRLVALPIGQNK